MSRQSDYATLAMLAAASLVTLHACATSPPPTLTTSQLVVTDDRCTVVTLRHDSGVEEDVCMSATDLKRAFDLRAGRVAGCK